MRRQTLFGLFVLAASTCCAQFFRPAPLNEAENYELKVGKMTMRIDAANGASSPRIPSANFTKSQTQLLALLKLSL